MFYTSMLGAVKGTFNRHDSFPIVFDTEGVATEDLTVRVRDKKIWVSNNAEGSDIFSLIGDDAAVPTNFKDGLNLTNEELADTEDNPMLVILTNSIRFYDNTPCYMKVLFINIDMMLVELIYGACEFAFSDGTYIPLQRCDDSDLNNKKVVATLRSRSLGERVLNATKGGWDKKYEMVNALFVKYDNGGDNAKYRFMKDNSYIFNEELIKAHEEEEEKVRLAKLDEEEQKKEIARKHLEEARIRHEEEERRAAREKIEKVANNRRMRNPKNTEEVKPKATGRNVSAADFLAAVSKIA